MNRSLAMLIFSVLLLAMILIVINRWSFGPPQEVTQQDPSVDFADILRQDEQRKSMPAENTADGGVRIAVAPSREKDSEGAHTDASPAGADENTPATQIPGGEKKDTIQPVANVDASDTTVTADASPPALTVPAQEQKRDAASSVASVPEKTGAAAQKQPAQAPVADTEKVVNAKQPVFNRITNVSVVQKAEGTVLRIAAVKPFAHKAFSLTAPARLVLDLTGKWQKPEALTLAANAKIMKIRPGAHAERLRLVLDLKDANPGKYTVIRPTPAELLLTLQ